MRFTGSEVFHDPEEVASEVEEFLLREA